MLLFVGIFSLLLSFSRTVWAQSGIDSTKCGSVFNTTADQLKAVDAYECLLTVPFNRTAATDFIVYWSDTLRFQSTLAYLKDPPSGYQQNSVDLLGGFELIQNQVDNGVFSNQYAFEATVHSLLQRAHDFHLGITGGVFEVFAFTPNIAFASVSLDGFELPKVYDANDLYEWKNGNSTSPPSSIAKVNGQITEKYFAAHGSRNSYGSIEPHADWNQIMWSFAAYIQGYSDPFSTPFYPGENLTIEYANGSKSDFSWNAVYVGDSPIPLITTGQDMYDWFVLAQDTQSDSDDDDDFDDNDSTTSTETPTPDPTATSDDAPDLTMVSTSTSTAQTDTFPGWGGAYPENPDVIQPNLGDGGFLTGYFLQDIKLGVLSIPSFAVADDPIAVRNFSATIKDFLTKSKDAGMTRILIDLQQNYGGEQLLAQETFRQFFPGMVSFEGMRTRSFDLADRLGTIMTDYYQQNGNSLNETLAQEFANDPWAVTNELNADTNKNFSSWQEYYGPHPDHSDAFSTVFRYNFLNPVFESVAGGIDITDQSIQSPIALYDARDIVILTDGVCASTCDLFIEMMHHQAGVRTVVVGGLPQEGPMQARGATRGALALNSYILDTNFAFAATVDNSILPFLRARAFSLSPTTGVFFNLADQIRANEYIPLQFTYEAADCRIFYTPDTYLDYTKLWEYAASAIFFNASTCVVHSAEHNNTMQTDAWGPSAEQLAAWAATNPANAPTTDQITVDASDGPIDFGIGFNEDMTYENTFYDGYIGYWECLGTPCKFVKKRKATSAENKARQPLTQDVYDDGDQLSNMMITTKHRSSKKGTSNGKSPSGSLRTPHVTPHTGRKRSLIARALHKLRRHA